MRMSFPSVAIAVLLWAAPGLPIAATAQARGSPAVLDPATRRAVVDSIANDFVRLYMDADTGRMIARHLRERAGTGAYDKLADPRQFADALTIDLQAVNGDKHLSVIYAPGARFDRPGANGIVDDTGVFQPSPEEAEDARRDHWSLGRVDVLPGNVGYMKIAGFLGTQAALDATSAALRYLEGTDAMIFDFRGMGGGDGDQSNLIISHFVGPDTVPTLVVTNRSSGRRKVRYTLASVTGARRPTVPIWILTDPGTASAGEDFTFVLRNLGRAKTVGERTAGAGHNNDRVDAGHGFGVSISYTRVADPRTGAEWERVGITPDVPVTPRTALSVAYAAALDSLARLAPDGPLRRSLTVLRRVALAEEHPPVVSAATLGSYTGTYEGGRVVALEAGALVFRRNATRPPRPLIALNDSTFALGMYLINFGRNSAGDRQMVQQPPDGAPFTLPRIGGVPQDLAP
jgi:hypothetical protein